MTSTSTTAARTGFGNPPPLRLVVGSAAGLRSQVWTIAHTRGHNRELIVGPEDCSWATSHPSVRAGWTVRVPADTAEEHSLADLPAAPDLPQQLDPPAPGWEIGLILLIPRVALAPVGPRNGVTVVPAPEHGRSAQITVLLAQPHAAEHGISDSPAAGSLLTDTDGLQIWKGQTALPPDLAYHLILVRQHLIEIAPPEPRELAAFSRLDTTSGVMVLVDLGLV